MITGLHVGGAEVVLTNLIEQIHAAVDLRVFSLKAGGPLKERIEASGVDVVGLDLRGIATLPGAFFRLRRELRRFRPDLVHSWMYHADLIGGLAARAGSLGPVLWGIHNSRLGRGSSLQTRVVVALLSRLASHLPDLIQSCSEAAAAEHVALGYPEAKIRIVPNGVDTALFRPDAQAGPSLRGDLGLDADARLIGTVGRFHPDKDYPTFLRAARALSDRDPRVHFVLAGRNLDTGNSRLVALVHSLDLQDRTHLLGIRDDVALLMPAFDVFGSSSVTEAFPVVLLEAMASGVPCVATDVGDSRLIVGDRGLTVPPRSPIELAAAWESILTLPAAQRLSLGASARQHVAERYSWPQVAAQFLALYREMIDGRRARVA